MSADNAIRLKMALEAGLTIPEDVHRWLLDGITACLSGHRLDDVLGLAESRGGGYATPAAVVRLESRGARIRALRYWACPDLGPWKASEAIAALLTTEVSV